VSSDFIGFIGSLFGLGEEKGKKLEGKKCGGN
jgi:hypothetical protein